MEKSKAYKVLGLSAGADEAAVKDAYRELARQYNDDEAKMAELNDAFDALMSYLRTGDTPAGENAAPSGGGTQSFGRYASIRQLINQGQVDEALAELGAIPNGAADAEWNFLMGSAYYYKGWLMQATQYFQEACRLDPSNSEYAAALRNLNQSAQGQMPGSPFTPKETNEAATLGCACNTCSMLCCMDMCCRTCG